MKNFYQDIKDFLHDLKEFFVIFLVIITIFSLITITIFSEDKSDVIYTEDYEVNGTSDNPYSKTSIDHNCSDFKSGKEAQLFYEANGGPFSDPHDLDRDNDGMACDWRP